MKIKTKHVKIIQLTGFLMSIPILFGFDNLIFTGSLSFSVGFTLAEIHSYFTNKDRLIERLKE